VTVVWVVVVRVVFFPTVVVRVVVVRVIVDPSAEVTRCILHTVCVEEGWPTLATRWALTCFVGRVTGRLGTATTLAALWTAAG
jgi:hypothetical protein